MSTSCLCDTNCISCDRWLWKHRKEKGASRITIFSAIDVTRTHRVHRERERERERVFISVGDSQHTLKKTVTRERRGGGERVFMSDRESPHILKKTNSDAGPDDIKFLWRWLWLRQCTTDLWNCTRFWSYSGAGLKGIHFTEKRKSTLLRHLLHHDTTRYVSMSNCTAFRFFFFFFLFVFVFLFLSFLLVLIFPGKPVGASVAILASGKTKLCWMEKLTIEEMKSDITSKRGKLEPSKK